MAALNSRAAAAYLSIGKTKLYTLIDDGELAYCDLGGQFSFLTADLDAYLRRHRIPSKAETRNEDQLKREPLTLHGNAIDIFTSKPLRTTTPPPAATSERGAR
jgi:excisionase family DNA binding protein